MQSFSYRVKSEIIEGINSHDKAAAALLGMLRMSKSFLREEICFVTENSETAGFFKKQIDFICRYDVAKETSVSKRAKAELYSIRIADQKARDLICDYYKTDQNKRLGAALPKKRNIPSFLAGVFLSCGSIIDPNKEYHIEFVMPSLDMCNDFGLLLIDEFGITAKYVQRKNSHVVYIKESENIEDILTIMGATKSSLELMNVKIFKDVRNKINRAVNCDNANIEKSLRAAERQIEDIELIDRTIGLDALSDDLIETARVRYENPDYNLKELGQALSPKISRSGANHRMERIRDIADKIRKNKELKTGGKK